MSGGTVADKILAIIDEIENRLKTDPRMPYGSTGFSISPLEVRRGERTAIPNQYPIAYIVHGEIAETELTTHSNDFTFTVWIQIFTRERNPSVGDEEIMKYIMSARRVFRENKADKHLEQSGVALVRHVAAPSYSWGAFQQISEAGDWEYGGQLQLEISFSSTD